MAGRVIEAQIVDNDTYNNNIGAQGEALRIANNFGANGGHIVATLSDNRSYNNYLALIVADNGSSFSNISVSSSGDKFFEKGLGALVDGGLSAGDFANGNTVSFRAFGDSFENNNGINNFDHGGLLIVGGENTTFPKGTSDNTVKVSLQGCRLAINQDYDLKGIGARSNPESIGSPGMNNHVTIFRTSFFNRPVQLFIDCIPDLPGKMNTVKVRNR